MPSTAVLVSGLTRGLIDQEQRQRMQAFMRSVGPYDNVDTYAVFERSESYSSSQVRPPAHFSPCLPVISLGCGP